MMQVDRREKYQQMRTLLHEKQWRQYVALEAKERGSVSLVAQEAGVSPTTIRRGVREVEAGEEREVNVYDFLSLADGFAIPYGM